MRLSYVIVTQNRCDSLLRTLGLLERTTPLPRQNWETWVVDNASTDETVRAVHERFPGVHVHCLSKNEGVSARSHAFRRAAGEYVVLLDDDSYPLEQTVTRSIDYLDSESEVAGVGGRVVHPGGGQEACAFPSVLASGAACLRRSVLLEVGGFRREFFRKAGEYDLSFRIWQAGYRLERFEDLVYCHDKVMSGRDRALESAMDLRNNLLLVERFLPDDMRRIYRRDWLRRYAALAAHAGCHVVVARAVREARDWARRERANGREILDDGVLESVFRWEEQRALVTSWMARESVRRVALANYGKNIFATFRACRRAGVEVVAVLEQNPAFVGSTYRGLPIADDTAATRFEIDGIVVANINPSQMPMRAAQLRERFDVPVLELWRPRHLAPILDGPTAVVS